MSSQDSLLHAENIVWSVCEKLRGAHSISEVFPLAVYLFVHKFLSDVASEKRENPAALRCSHPLWASLDIPPEYDWNSIAEAPSRDQAVRVSAALKRVKSSNSKLLDGILGWFPMERANELEANSLADAIGSLSALDLRPLLAGTDLVNVYDRVLARFADSQGTLGEFSVPSEICKLMAHLLEPAPGDSIYDPFCRSGQLLTQVSMFAQKPSLVAGQTRRTQDVFFSRVNMLLGEFEASMITVGDSIWSPPTDDKGRLNKFDIVVSNPPFGAGEWGAEMARSDPFGRFDRGIPPDSRSDYAFISHAVASMKEDGRAAIVVSLGSLFRGGGEAAIRRRLVIEGLVDGVVSLPANLFSATKIAVAVILLKKNRATRDVLFVDAAREFSSSGRRSVLRDEAIGRIAAAFKSRESIQGFSRTVAPEEISSNDFNLSVPRYIGNPEKGSGNFKKIWAEASATEAELGEVERELDALLEDLGLLDIL